MLNVMMPDCIYLVSEKHEKVYAVFCNLTLYAECHYAGFIFARCHSARLGQHDVIITYVLLSFTVQHFMVIFIMMGVLVPV
jgi:hypothetical protein